MTQDVIKKVKVHYRLAKLNDGEQEGPTLQQQLTDVMKSSLGADTRTRILPMADDEQHKGCLNFSEAAATFFVADIMHLDGRTTLPRWIHPTEPKPYAEISRHEIADGEASLGEPAYVMIAGNHVAAIERMNFRATNLARYLNELLALGGVLDANSAWKLVPRNEAIGDAWKGGGVKKITLKPKAAFGGFGPSQTPIEKDERRARALARKFDNLVARGADVLAALAAFGADETKLEALRQAMSSDLVLKARLELTVAATNRKSRAEIAPDLVEQALADLAQDGEVIIQSADGRSDGKLIQLSTTAEVLETGGLIEWKRAVQALSSALSGWAAKGAITLPA